MHLIRHVLLRAFQVFESEIGVPVKHRDEINRILSQYNEVMDLPFDEARARETLEVIGIVFDYGFSVLDKLGMSDFADHLGDDLAQFAKTHYQEVSQGNSLETMAHLIILMFIYGYSSRDVLERLVSVVEFSEMGVTPAVVPLKGG